MKAEKVILTKRLQMIADMITMGNRLVDVGCDHGYLPLYVLQQGISPSALAMDVNQGPLEAARKNVEEAGLSECIQLRLSDGLKAYNAGESDTMVCAGMGGPLMEKILTESFDKVMGLKELILQPQSEITQFRQFLRRNGLHIVEEDAVEEEGKYYIAMKVIPGAGQEGEQSSGEFMNAVEAGEEELEQQKLFDTYGECLLRSKHPVLKEYLEMQLKNLQQIEGGLELQKSEKAFSRLPEIREEIGLVESALSYISFDV